MTGQTAAYDFRGFGVGEGSWRKAVEAQDRGVPGAGDGEEGLCGATIMTLPGEPPQEFVERGIATVKGLAVVARGNRLLMPGGELHGLARGPA